MLFLVNLSKKPVSKTWLRHFRVIGLRPNSLLSYLPAVGLQDKALRLRRFVQVSPRRGDENGEYDHGRHAFTNDKVPRSTFWGVHLPRGRGNCRFGGGLASIRYSKHAKPMLGVFDVKKHGDKEGAFLIYIKKMRACCVRLAISAHLARRVRCNFGFPSHVRVA